MTRYYLGVDGGGTNCRIRLADENLVTLADAAGGRSNLQIDAGDPAFRSITEGTKEVFAKAGIDFAQTRVEIIAGWTAERVTITIADDGPGFAPAILGTLGDPYVTSRGADRTQTKDDQGGGLGLGFFIAKTLLERSGAEIDVANREQPQSGAVVQISWPRASFEKPIPRDDRLFED